MPILSPSQFRAKYQIDASVANAVFEDAVLLADATLVDWFGSAAYSDAEAESPSNRLRAQTILAVGNYMAMYHALPALSTRVMGNGVAMEVWMPDGSKVKDLTPEEIEVKRAALLSVARDLAKTIPTTPAFYTVNSAPSLLAPMI